MNRLKLLREQKGLNMREAARLIGIPYTTYVNYEKGEREPNSETLIKLADFFETTIDYLLCKVDSPALYEGRGNFEYAFDISRIHRVPRLGVIACGEPVLAEQNIENYDQVPDWVNCDFTLLCKGDSMTGARIYDGDIVCIKQQPTVENGQIAAVIIEGEFDSEATLKRVRFRKGNIELWPENPAYEPYIFSDEDKGRVRILGLATHFISTIR